MEQRSFPGNGITRNPGQFSTRSTRPPSREGKWVAHRLSAAVPFDSFPRIFSPTSNGHLPASWRDLVETYTIYEFNSPWNEHRNILPPLRARVLRLSRVDFDSSPTSKYCKIGDCISWLSFIVVLHYLTVGMLYSCITRLICFLLIIYFILIWLV